MKHFLIFSAVVAAAIATGPGSVQVSQDTSGNYNLNYNFAGASRSEQGFAGGNVIGSYSFTDKYGRTHPIQFESGVNGFVARGEVPVPVQETQAVSEVRAVHNAENARLRSILPPLIEDPVVQFVATPVFRTFQAAPQFTHTPRVVIDNSAEIAAAKAQHFAAHQEALARLAEAYRTL